MRLPRTEPAAIPGPEEAALPGKRKRRVLIVEDGKDARESLQQLLELDGHEVALAADGPEGLRQLQRLRPDVALIDIGLPGMDGYELARAARAAVGPGVTLVALTGYGQPAERAKALASGFDLHLTKPVALRDLDDALQR